MCDTIRDYVGNDAKICKKKYKAKTNNAIFGCKAVQKIGLVMPLSGL